MLLPLCNLYSQEKGAREDNTLRIMSYNIRNGRGMDDVSNFQRTADVINKVRPNVVAVQEVDSVTGRSGQIDVLRVLADKTLMFPIYAPAIDYDGGKYGIGMLAKEKPLGYRYLALPGREEERALLIVEFEKYIYCCTHLSLTGEDRLASLDIIRREAAKANKPLFIAGDFNAHPDSEVIKGIQKDFVILTNTKQPTFPADEPTETIDYIAAYAKDTTAFTRLSSWVVNEPAASDHRPIVTDIVFMQPADKIFRTEPYLQNPVGNGITVMWQTTVPTYSWVEYGTDKNQLKKARTIVDGQVICNDLQNKIRLNDLEPGKTYYYRICSQEIMLYQAYKKVFGETAVSDFHTFTLPAASDTDFTAIIFNDLHKHSETLQALYKQVKDVDYDFVIFNGDCIDDPANHDEATHFLSELNETVGATDVPVFYLRGNHEIRNAYSIGLRKLFDYVGDKTYGAFNWGDTRIVMLDCGEDKPDDHWVYYGLNDFSALREAQVGFLKEELASKPFKQATKRVLIHHVPIYGKDVDRYNPCLELWGGLLAKAPFNVCINAHTHRNAYYPKGDANGNNFPVIVGGGYRMDGATVMVLQKKGKDMTLKVLNTKGETLQELKL
ncbi:endonuclease/exonuclease/phosphatase family protein [Parabacteroides sp. TM07-1AC]|uniref:endonuclease/exonuclease/phosphatase family protein n=1 Tax=Parabacteroides sp. TM07-1AC TaxID=2292363 RepID=UPI0018F28BA1|nr:endonuclease/exonuclease/phosphatase family protein [Parabacteroides sp. TM07-1AC]